MKFKLHLLLLTFLSMGAFSKTYATDYYSDPVGGSMGNSGSISSPWGNLQSIFGAGKTFVAGDVIFLMDGAHGQSYITGTHSDYVTIKPLPGHTPKIAAVQLGTGSYWAFEGLTFTADGAGGTFTQNYLLLAGKNLTYLKVENCTFYSAESSASWSKADWYANAEDGVRIRGSQTIFNNNLIKNTMFALEFSGTYVEAKNNVIDNFGGDALRALASHGLYENNLIRDAYIEDYAVNHDDGIQMYPIVNGAFDPNGVFDNMIFRNNQIYTFADPITQSMIDDDLIGYSMQSLIVTDGHIENSVVENNLIVGDHFHGITLSGAINCRVQNNTVMKTPTPVNPNAYAIPWVKMGKDKQGNASSNCTVRNNIFSDYQTDGGINILLENNLEPAAAQYVNVFADYANFDLSLATNSVAIDAGVNTDLTVTDIVGNPRLAGTAVDQGAYEFQVRPVISEAPNTYFNDQVTVVFDRTVTLPSAEVIGNYILSHGASILLASLDANGNSVTLTTSPLTNGIVYTVTADGVEDAAGNAATDTSADFQYLCDTSWASTFQDDQWGTHPPEYAFDGDLSTKWAAMGIGEWIQYGFCEELNIQSIDIAFTLGDQRSYSFIIEVSTDGRTFTQVFDGASSGTSSNLESFVFSDTPAKYVRVTGSGNSVNLWNNYAEIIIHTSAIQNGYEAWILNYPDVGTATNQTDNPDNDPLNNLYEWGLGGNPSDSNDVGHVPTFGIIENMGSEWLEYSYAKRSDADELGLVYYLEQNTMLTNTPAWTNANYESMEGAVDSAGPGFNTVSNWVNTVSEDSQFLRLIIETN